MLAAGMTDKRRKGGRLTVQIRFMEDETTNPRCLKHLGCCDEFSYIAYRADDEVATSRRTKLGTSFMGSMASLGKLQAYWKISSHHDIESWRL